ncbi:hypothetical protein I6E68_03395 [Salinibacterium sp. NSLL150]|uniref:hypothetical protein n=1 Tax=unclassified Salinibacterium TaxID=2632331 RepID=UPI0018CF2878|nr:MULTISPECIES: hypothetical protein [unclassified Salinibacterium]MBH0098181.1 hypothetical protein [Salinibacterium sp. NSLL35]MBH0100936.1 hypothetical protein [Salinibacterium sp. NSLL150]MBH0103695.1 hypothetical protein [Salinibacterium sp. NSLL16]MBH0106456.1 hypothetical protein [Salinibacterium sp. NSLL17]
MTEKNPSSAPSSAEPSSAESSSGELQASDVQESEPSVTPLREQTDPAAVSAAPAARRRWPWWAWALVLVIPFMLISGMGAALVANVLVSRATSALICYADGYCSLGSSSESTPSATADPVDSVDPSNRVPLDGQAVFDGQPVWTLALESTWLPLTVGHDGTNIFHDEATGCQLITSQRTAFPNPDSLGDDNASYALVDQELRDFTARNPNLSVRSPMGTTDLPVAAANSDSTMEFATATLEQTDADGVPTTTAIAARSMPSSESELVATLTCNTAAFETFDSKFELFSSALAVIVLP